MRNSSGQKDENGDQKRSEAVIDETADQLSAQTRAVQLHKPLGIEDLLLAMS